jgi:hydrogenase maturation protein HypF
MLPYTPLHHLLMREINLPLVMTSGNLTEEPIAYKDDDALKGWAK